MKILGIDTSTATGSVALRSDQKLIGLLTVSVDLTHSEGLMPAVDTLLRSTNHTPNNLTAVACVSGPGSYTGLRVGIASAQGLATPKRLPCVALSSLEVYAHALPYSRYPLCPLLTARKGWVYARLYRWQNRLLQPISEELNVKVEELIKHIHNPTVFYGPGLAANQELLKGVLGDQFLEPSPVFHAPRADLVTDLAFQKIQNGETLDPSALLPHYLGPCQAEVNWNKQRTKSVS